jgi:hypothetical protein
MSWLAIAAFTIAATLWGCSSPTATACTDEVLVRPVPGDTTLSVGQQFTAHVFLSTCGGTRQLTDSFTWTSQDSTVARVDRFTGVAIGVASGRTRLLATGTAYGQVGGSSITVR